MTSTSGSDSGDSGSSGSGDEAIGANVTEVTSKITTTTESLPEEKEVASNVTTTESLPEETEVASNVTEKMQVAQLSNTTTTALAEVTEQVVLVLKGNFSEVIGEGEENKQKFLTACTLKLSKNNTRDVRCADVRPGSIIVDIEGAPKQLGELAEELKTEKSFALEGYADFTVDKLDYISATTTTKPPATTTIKTAGTTTTKTPLEEIEDIGSPIIKYLMENVGVLVAIIIAAVLVLMIIGTTIFVLYKHYQPDQKEKTEDKKKEVLNVVTETLVESKVIRTPVKRDSQVNQTVVISSPMVVVTDGGSEKAKATTVVVANPQIETAPAQRSPKQLDEENAYAVEMANAPDNAAGQNAQADEVDGSP